METDEKVSSTPWLQLAPQQLTYEYVLKKVKVAAAVVPAKRRLRSAAEDKENVAPATVDESKANLAAGAVPRKLKGILKTPRRAGRPSAAVVKSSSPGKQLQVEVPGRKSVHWAQEVVAKVSVRVLLSCSLSVLLRSPRDVLLTTGGLR